MANFHIGANGPTICKATVRDCPLGGEHFDNHQDAQKEFERQMESDNNMSSRSKNELSASSKSGFKFKDRGLASKLTNLSNNDSGRVFSHSFLKVSSAGQRNNGQLLRSGMLTRVDSAGEAEAKRIAGFFKAA